MSIREEPDSTRVARPEVLAILDKLLTSGTVRSVFYVGYAHEAILFLLHQQLGTNFSVMDWWDRWGVGASFYGDEHEDAVPEPSTPPWLEGVQFHFEGVGEADLFLRDMPWRYPEQLEAILAPDYCRRRPSHLLLVDEAASASRHPDYTWTVAPHYALGIFNSKPRGR